MGQSGVFVSDCGVRSMGGDAGWCYSYYATLAPEDPAPATAYCGGLAEVGSGVLCVIVSVFRVYGRLWTRVTKSQAVRVSDRPLRVPDRPQRGVRS